MDKPQRWKTKNELDKLGLNYRNGANANCEHNFIEFSSLSDLA